MSQSSKKKIGFLARLANKLTVTAKITIYKSIIAPHFDFCSSILFLADQEDKTKFQKLQNRAMRVILKCNRYTSVARMVDALQWQTVWQRIVSRSLQFIFKVKNGWLPQYLEAFIRYNTDVHTYQSRRRCDFRTPLLKKTSSQNNIFFKGLKLFNSLPQEIKNETKFSRFKRKINEYVKANVI